MPPDNDTEKRKRIWRDFQRAQKVPANLRTGDPPTDVMRVGRYLLQKGGVPLAAAGFAGMEIAVTHGGEDTAFDDAVDLEQRYESILGTGPNRGLLRALERLFTETSAFRAKGDPQASGA